MLVGSNEIIKATIIIVIIFTLMSGTSASQSSAMCNIGWRIHRGVWAVSLRVSWKVLSLLALVLHSWVGAAEEVIVGFDWFGAVGTVTVVALLAQLECFVSWEAAVDKLDCADLVGVR
jgi:hypothetical protein